MSNELLKNTIQNIDFSSIFPSFAVGFLILRRMALQLRNYETIFILSPVLTDEQVQAIVTKVRNLLIEKEAEIIHEQAMGLRNLAYPIQHNTTGVYYLFEFKAIPTVITALDIAYKRDENIIRFLIFLLNKHAIEYNQQYRNSMHMSKDEPKKSIVA